MDQDKARTMLLRQLLASHAQRLQQQRFFSVQLALVYADEKGRLGAYELPFAAERYFTGNGDFNERMDKLTVAVTDPANRDAITQTMVPGFVGLSVVLNTTVQSADLQVLSPQFADGYLVAALIMLDDTTKAAMWHLATGTADFPDTDEAPWDFNAVFQLLYGLDDIQSQMAAVPHVVRGRLIALEPGGGAQRLELPPHAQGVKKAALLVL